MLHKPKTAAQKYDKIFGGGQNDRLREDNYSHFTEEANHVTCTTKINSSYHDTSYRNIEEQQENELKTIVHNIMINEFNHDPTAPMRKPKKHDFNKYYNTIIKKVDLNLYNKSSILVVLSSFFSNNLYSMFELLYTHHAESIMAELQSKFRMGEKYNGKELTLKTQYLDPETNKIVEIDTDITNIEFI